jgi:dTDP-4-amino-4,6-dideoxy-D-galactose acyltransferase
MTSNYPNDCEFLPWDSEFFGLRIARLQAKCLLQEHVGRVQDWCRLERIDCLYFLADCQDTATMALVPENGFFLADIRITLGGNPDLIAELPASQLIRRGRVEDLDRLAPIARSSHQDSRFYFDKRFPRQRCDELYATWLRKSFSGYADAVLVAEWNGVVAGYITCRITAPGRGEIGLLGVDARAQGVGLGPQLVRAALRWFKDRAVKQVLVVTQGRNVRAQRCYQRAGFLTDKIEIWFHRWFNHGSDNNSSLVQ